MSDWKKCTSCKKPVSFGQKFWVCNVSTCNRRRTGLRFCSVECYDAHLPLMNHRESWALEVRAPGADEWNKYAKEEGEDAVWPPKPAAPKEEMPQKTPAPSAPTVIRRRKA